MPAPLLKGCTRETRSLAVFPHRDASYATVFDALPVPSPIANDYCGVADDLIGEIEYEHAPIRFRPNHILHGRVAITSGGQTALSLVPSRAAPF
jgi:hypothetical protein